MVWSLGRQLVVGGSRPPTPFFMIVEFEEGIGDSVIVHFFDSLIDYTNLDDGVAESILCPISDIDKYNRYLCFKTGDVPIDVPERPAFVNKLRLVYWRDNPNSKYMKYMSCRNCKYIQGCKRLHSFYSGGLCEDFIYCGDEIEPKPKRSKYFCSGCRNNYYNYGEGRSRSIGKNGCMSYGHSSVVLRDYPFGINHRPPWELRWVLDCFQRRWH